MYSIQGSLGMAVVLLVLQPLFDAPDTMGAVVFGGWAGGYGTAAAMATRLPRRARKSRP